MFAVLAALLAALCFSTTGTAQALADVDASPLAVGAARIIIGGAILGIIALVRSRLRSRAQQHRAVAPGRPSRVPLVVGAVGVVAYQPAFFTGAAMNGVAIGTMVAIGSAPVMTGVLGGIMHRRMPGTRWMTATTLALVGVVLVSGLLSGSQVDRVSPVGLAASAGAGLSFAVYTLASKQLFLRSWSSTEVMGSMYGIAALLSLPLLLAAGTAWLLTAQGIALALWLGVVTTALGYLLFGSGLRQLSPTTVATLTLAEPLSATLFGLFVLHEQLTPDGALGLAVIAAGLVVLSFRNRPGVPRVAVAA